MVVGAGVHELGHNQIIMMVIGVVRKCSLYLLEQGDTGSFKIAKHIKVRIFWLKDFFDDDEIEHNSRSIC